MFKMRFPNRMVFIEPLAAFAAEAIVPLMTPFLSFCLGITLVRMKFCCRVNAVGSKS
jgi:hypothetical protein